MEKLLRTLYRALCDTALVFCGIVMFFALFIFDTDTAHFTTETLLAFFFFALFFGAASVLFAFKGVPSVISLILHFILTTVGYATQILTLSERSSAQIFVGIVIFVVVYWAGFGIVKLLKLPLKKKDTNDTSVMGGDAK